VGDGVRNRILHDRRLQGVHGSLGGGEPGPMRKLVDAGVDFAYPAQLHYER
jgi:hypothetical protein